MKPLQANIHAGYQPIHIPESPTRLPEDPLFLLIVPLTSVLAATSSDEPRLLITQLSAAQITRNLPITERTVGKSDNGRKRVRWTIRGLNTLEIIGNNQSNADEVAWHCGSYDKNGNFLSPVPIDSFCGRFFISVLGNMMSSPSQVAATLLKRADTSGGKLVNWRFGSIKIETDGQFFFIKHLANIRARVAQTDAPLTIGVSYNQIMAHLDQFISMSRAHDVRGGVPRYMGQSSDHGAILEIIGRKDNVLQATLMIGLPKDSPKIMTGNTLLVLLFLKNTAPNWKLRADWAASALKRVNSTGDPETILRGNKSIQISLYKDLGLVSVLVKNKDAP